MAEIASRAFWKLEDGILGARLWLTDVGERRAWRLAKWCRSSLVGVHEKLLQKYGPKTLPVTDSRGLRRLQMAAPQYPFFDGYVDRSELLEQIVKGSLPLTEGRAIPVDSISYLDDPFGGLSSLARLTFHSLEWIEILLQSYESHGGDEKLELAVRGAERWAEECLFAESNENIWSDHAAALRAIVLCHLNVHLADARDFATDFAVRLRQILWRHGRRLFHPGFYRPEHDHGITQAYALLACGLLLGDANGERWAACGQRRLEEQMRDNVSGEGLHREQSPYYHFYAFRQFFDAWELSRLAGLAFSPAYEEKLRRMLLAGTNYLKPSGGLFAFGDTDRSSPIVLRGGEYGRLGLGGRDPYSSIQGGRGPVVSSSVVLRDGGMAFLRKSSEQDARAPRMTVPIRVSTLDIAHAHRDLASFELSAYGDELVVDSGGPYAYGSPERRRYFLSTAAHNTIVRPGQEQKPASSEIRRWETSDEHDVLELEHRAYGDLVHRRTMVLSKSGFLLIVDQVSSPKDDGCAVLFHLDASLEPKIENGEIWAPNGRGGTGLRMKSVSMESTTMAMGRGGEGSFESWICAGERVRQPNWVVAYETKGRRSCTVTLLVPERRGEDLSASRLSLVAEGSTFGIEVFCRGVRTSLGVAELPPEVGA